MKVKLTIEIISGLFIALFVYAAISKVLDYDLFITQVKQSPILSAHAGWIVWVVPSAEILISIALALEATRQAGLFASFGLMSMFTMYILAILISGERVPCSCGGVLETLNWKEHLAFNVVFVLLALVGITLSALPGEKNTKDARTLQDILPASRIPREKRVPLD